MIFKTSKFDTKYTSSNEHCIYNKINSNIKTTFDIYFRKKVSKYAIETYNDPLFQSCYEAQKFIEVNPNNPAEKDIYYRITSGVKNLKQYWKKINSSLYQSRPMSMIRDLSHNYEVDTGFDELQRRMHDKTAVDSKIEQMRTEATLND